LTRRPPGNYVIGASPPHPAETGPLWGGAPAPHNERTRTIVPKALAADAMGLTSVAVPYVLIVGFVIAGVAGYMAGLIGSSNSPISGIGILSIVIFASVLALAPAAYVHARSRFRSRRDPLVERKKELCSVCTNSMVASSMIPAKPPCVSSVMLTTIPAWRGAVATPRARLAP
jgi:hypothetical protein